jgi:AP-4 complex subunit epsilon-1
LTSKKQAREFLVRLLYVEMLGHDASFGYIKAVEMAASTSLYHKRTGYLVCGACLPPTHEFRFMLVNQMQRDLQSTNVLECSGGVLACTNLITSDMVPAVAGEVTKLLLHDSATIRKKSIVALHRFYQLADDVVTFNDLHTHLRKILCDRDPSVMGACLNVIEALSRQDAQPFKDLIPSLVSILKQINDHRLPSDYDYHRVPAPWIQIKLVRLLGVLGHADAQASAGVYEILLETLKKADTGINAGYAIVYECIQTIVSLYPNPRLLDAAAEAIARFMQSRSHNLKYLGVTGLALIVELHPQYAAQHQLAVLDCLEDPDETLQRKTLDLLYRMTNPVNVEFIADKLLDFLEGTTDLFLKKILTTRVCSIAEKFAPNNSWYIRTITQLCKVSGDMVSPQVAQNLMSLIAEGTGESEEADIQLRQAAVDVYVNLLMESKLPRILIETMAWCLGEYGYLSTVQNLDQVMAQLCVLATKQQAKLSASTRRFVVQALMKLVAQAGTCPPMAAAVIEQYTKSRDVDLQQRCLEFQKLLTICPHLLPEVLPVDASAEDVQVDETLSFLDSIVMDAINQGARPYSKPEDDDDDDYQASNYTAAKTAFKMTPYEKPQAPAQAMLAMSGMGSAGRSSTLGMSLPPGAPGSGGGGGGVPMPLQQPTDLSLNTRNVANVWGKGGLRPATATTMPAASTPAAAPPPSQPVSTNAWGSNSISMAASPYRGSGGMSNSMSSPEPVKTAQQLEKERIAAALFGGIVPGATPSTPAQTHATMTTGPSRSTIVAPTPPPAPAPAPPPAADVDLLDMSAWDATPAAPVSTNFDVLDTAPVSVSASAAAVETVSDDEDELTAPAAPPPASGAPPDLDPFASAGLLSDISEKPLASLLTSQKFEYNGSSMAPLQINTAQFGQHWGTCPAMSPVSIMMNKAMTLNAFMDVCARMGAFPVEAIGATNEGICAGMLSGGAHIALLHGKIAPAMNGTKVDITVKSTDKALCGALAIYLQTMLR